MLKRSLALLLSAGTIFGANALPPDHAERLERGLESFQKEIRPLLVESCLKCHGGEKTKGEFNLATREGLLKGGVDGLAVVAFQSSESRLLKLLRHAEEPHMPDKAPQLADETIQKVSAWIDNGAPYEAPLIASAAPPKAKGISEEDRKWWAFQPLAKVSPPNAQGAGHPVDQFILAKAAEKNLSLAAPAERRVLIRRLCLDLHGVPPEPEEIEAFVRDDSAGAWPRLVERALNSPRYGERWARHWLDLARFAESSGFEHDYDREGAYQYRDFVIRALNADMPFDQFLKWQVAGDEFEPENPMALAATGFLGAGVFPTQITANEVERTRYDAMDDMLSTTSVAFLGLTVGCARCHDHKFDPFPTADYYKLLSSFTTTTRSVIDLDVEPEKTAVKTEIWARAHAPIQKQLADHETALKPKFEEWLRSGAAYEAASWSALEWTNRQSKAGATFKALEDGSYLAQGKNGDKDEYAFQASLALSNVTGLKLEALADPSLPKGGPGRADNGNIGLSRIRIFAAPAAGGATQEVKIAKAVATFEQNKDSLSIASALDDKANTGWAVDPQFATNHAAVFTFEKAIDGPAILTVQLEFALNTRHNIGRPRLSVMTGGEPALDGEVVSPQIAQLLARAKAPGFASEITSDERALLFDAWKKRDAGWRERMANVDAHLKAKPTGLTKALVCAEGYKPLRMHTQGADFFEQTYILRRGNTDLKNGVAEQDFLQVLMRAPEGGKRWAWQPPKEAKFSGRRRALANWMTDVDAGAGAQVARVLVNRLWQHHFGQGLVSTPNDFGKAGALPSHPELLDYLAGELIRNGWQLKPIHRLLLTSLAWQQNSGPDAAKVLADPDNKYFTRRQPRRLEGEALRDSVLAVSGALDPRMYGPGTMNESSVRRSIYFTVKRSQLVGSMVVFDQPEPLVSQGARSTTTVAPQALFLMNAPQVRAWAESFARRLANEPSLEAKIAQAFALALGRAPGDEERKQSLAFIDAQQKSYLDDKKENARELALADFCQVIFGLNEFAYEN